VFRHNEVGCRLFQKYDSRTLEVRANNILRSVFLQQPVNLSKDRSAIYRERRGGAMNRIFYIIGVVVVILIVLGYLGFRH
jgi:hypothetical protein